MLALAGSRRNSIWCRITCTWSRRKARNTTNKAFCHFCSSLPSASALQSHFGRKIHQQQGLQTDGGSKCRMWYWSYKEVNKQAPGISSFSVAWFWHSLRLWLSRPLLWRTWVPSKFQNTHKMSSARLSNNFRDANQPCQHLPSPLNSDIWSHFQSTRFRAAG